MTDSNDYGDLPNPHLPLNLANRELEAQNTRLMEEVSTLTNRIAGLAAQAHARGAFALGLATENKKLRQKIESLCAQSLRQKIESLEQAHEEGSGAGWNRKALALLQRADRLGLDAQAVRLLADNAADLNLTETAEALRIFAVLLERPWPAPEGGET